MSSSLASSLIIEEELVSIELLSFTSFSKVHAVLNKVKKIINNIIVNLRKIVNKIRAFSQLFSVFRLYFATKKRSFRLEKNAAEKNIKHSKKVGKRETVRKAIFRSVLYRVRRCGRTAY